MCCSPQGAVLHQEDFVLRQAKEQCELLVISDLISRAETPLLIDQIVKVSTDILVFLSHSIVLSCV